ncbi:MAG TPA: cupin domain-containing protein [Actinomycetales bacterium]|nr:cupin domain-containing protein [Actinomycetales bacterium]
MTYSSEAGQMSAILRDAGQVEELRVGETRARLVAPGSVTGGQYGLFEWHMAASSGGASPHFHRTFSEAFYVMSGTVTLFDGRSWTKAGAGDFLFVPEGGVHGFRNDADEPASMLILFAPGAPREDYFRELAEIRTSGRQLSQDEWLELWARHDQYPAPDATP